MDSVEVQLKVLMLAASSGNRKAYEQLLASSAVRLRSYFGRRIGRDTADVEDLVQETLMAIHQRRASYDPALPFTAWLHAIAYYKLVDQYRRSGSRAHVPLDEAAELIAADTLGPAIAAVDVEKLLAELPQKQREAIQLTRIAGYSVAEAAGVTGQSASGIKVSVHRGVKRLISKVEIK
jgi:RNA polymerase sigma-70 factor (ECF subfamily)